MLTSMRAETLQEDYTPWILGQPHPAETKCRWVLVVPESHLIRLTLEVSSDILTHQEALLYAVEPHVPSIDGRDVLLLHSEPSQRKGWYQVELLLYPREQIELALATVPPRQAVAGVMAASDWWDIALPDETALWVENGHNAWVRLPSGRVHAVNRSLIQMLASANPSLGASESEHYGMKQLSCWIHQIDEPLKGVMIYSDEPEQIKSYCIEQAWPESVRSRILPLSALYEAPRDYSKKWNLWTKKRWTVSTASPFFAGQWKRSYGAVIASLLAVGIAGLLYPVAYTAYSRFQDTATLRSAWERQYPQLPIPDRVEAAWLDQIAKQPWGSVDKPPHFDPIGMWGYINRLAIGLALPELQNLRYEGNRWWLKWPKSLSLSKLAKFKKRLLGAGWKVDTKEEVDGIQVVISAIWLE